MSQFVWISIAMNKSEQFMSFIKNIYKTLFLCTNYKT